MLKVKGNIWIESENGPFMGLGRMRLLEEIERTGSITAAAKAIKMSYRQAWELADTMNKRWEKPLITTSAGGQGGGGAKLTAEGMIILRKYKEILARFNEFNSFETIRLTS